ncbi:type III pantothenate kinase [Spiroplasma chinense]|uniref:Type III pantothenate kinase n=1 Tax=Spiroplasma chinense TaxID=216932 RepID=A0A5B9Y5D0_9MOLU|nr:type III pantothenate kinase [Spiroplasma chinense]QEH62251.1 type III pantothenate kinase [Spiroplasma chinense]
MSILLIDIGNTTADFRYCEENGSELFSLVRPATYSEEYTSDKKIIEIINQKGLKIDTVVYSSVVPNWNVLIRAIASALEAKLVNVRDFVFEHCELFEVDDVNRVGADFIANYFAATDKYNIENGIVVSMGTATTLLLIQNKKFVGTVIAPGLESSLNGLISNASLLKEFEYNKTSKLIGKNTVDAIDIGAFDGHWCLVKGLIDKLTKDFKVEKTVITGGNAIHFKQEMNENNFIYDEELIFFGLSHILTKK